MGKTPSPAKESVDAQQVSAMALEVSLSYPIPEPACEDRITTEHCHAPDTKTFFGSKLCEWNKCADQCNEVEPPDDPTPEHFVMLMAVMIFFLPILAAFGWAMDEYLSKPVPPELRCWSLYGAARESDPPSGGSSTRVEA